MGEFKINSIKTRIISSIRDLDKSDYIDICSLIKLYVPVADGTCISITERGTYVNLDHLSEALLRQLDDMVLTKLQRIHLEQTWVIYVVQYTSWLIASLTPT